MDNQISITEDKFKGTKIHQLNRSWLLVKDSNLNELELSIEYMEIKSVQTDVSETTDEQNENYEHIPTTNAIRLIVKLQSKDWWFLHHGELMFLASNKTINLGHPVGRNSFTDIIEKTQVDINKGLKDNKHVVCKEHCVYLISKDDLKTICDSNSLDFQISGKNIKHEGSFDKINIDYFRLFYQRIFDNTLYNEVNDRINFYQIENRKNNIIGFGGGCVLPFILFILSAYGLFGAVSFEENNLMFLPFWVSIVAWVIYFVRNKKLKNKVNQ